MHKPQTAPTSIDRLKQQIAQLDALIADGTLSGDTARQAREKLEAELVSAVLQAPPAADAALGAAQTAAKPVVPVAAKPSLGQVLAVSAFVVVFGAAGYAWRGNHAGWSIAPDTPPEAQQAAAQSAQQVQLDAMIEQLAQRLKEKPDDADGWSMLGRSYNAQGKMALALSAYKKALELRPDDAQALADYADALAVTNNRSLDGEPERLIQKALGLDPKNVKALALAGTIAYNRADFRLAAAHWQQAVSASDPQSEFTRQLQGALDDARQRAGLPVLAAAGSTPSAPAGPGAAAANDASAVSGTVSLSEAARAKVQADDTVFIYARASSGSRMPLAILRKKVGDLPLDFRLDDSMAMSPAARLSGAPQVIVSARVSKAGTAVAAPGDWQGQSAAVAPGAKGLRIEISELIP